MSDDREHRVRTRAYHIWERDGRAGRAEDHWLEAEAEIGRESEAPPAEPPKAAKRAAEPAAKAKVATETKTQADAPEALPGKPAAKRGKTGAATAKAAAPRPRRTPPA